MALTLYSGVPGSGKSYALMQQVILPAYKSGRRVVTNLDGIKPDAIKEYCLEKWPDADLGEIVVVTREQLHDATFYPTSEWPPEKAFLDGGDFLVVDEFGTLFPSTGKLPVPTLKGFLAYHRHFVGVDGRTCDVVIATQSIRDVHKEVLSYLEASYKFRKLKSLGANRSYAWDAYEGDKQTKAYSTGNGKYKPAIFALYDSYSGGYDATEEKTDKRRGALGKMFWSMAVLVVVLIVGGSYGVWRFLNPAELELDPMAAAQAVNGVGQSNAQPIAQRQPPKSNFWIVGHVQGDAGYRVIVTDGRSVRVVKPDGFTFDGNRPVEGVVEGKRVIAEERVTIDREGMMQ